MEDEGTIEHLTLQLNDSEELNAVTLTTLLNSGVEEALSNLSPAQLIQLEKNVQKLKRQKSSLTTPTRTPKAPGSAGRKRRLSEDGDEELRPRPSGGQYMNLPASTPQVEFREGIEWLHFTYSTKGHIQEYCIRADIDDLMTEDIPEDFKKDNCVYPRALFPREQYVGNRWEYETSVNELAWKLTWRNPGVLCGRRGLIQRAVDSYRNRTPENRSRRVMRQEKLTQPGHRSRASSVVHSHSDDGLHVPGPKTLTLQYPSKDGEHNKVKIRVDVEGVDLSELDNEFRQTNAIYPQALTDRESYPEGRWEYENACNELAWKLAWLNMQKLAGKKSLLQKAVDAYQTRIEAAERARRQYMRSGDLSGMVGLDDVLLGKSEEFSQMVAHTLQQAISHNSEDLLHDDEDHPQTVSTAELMGHIISSN